MPTLHCDALCGDDARRERIYRGDIFLYTPRPATVALCDFGRQLVEEAFAPRDPRTAQHEMPVEEYAALLATLKPRFIHHPEMKRLIPELLHDAGCDLDEVDCDVPRLRTSTAGGYLTTGIAYAFHPHRDTWYSAPFCQINWWLPLYELAPDNGIGFHPRYWDRKIANSSRVYDYAEWNRVSRHNAAQHLKTDTRVQPRPEEPVDLGGEIRPVVPADGMIVLSAAQLHSSVPNRSGVTRLSIDFRTVHRGDAREGFGAVNVDSECTGTTMGDYLAASTLRGLPPELIEAYERGEVPPRGPRSAAG